MFGATSHKIGAHSISPWSVPKIPQVEAVHADAVAQAERFLDWLSLELQWGQTGAEATRERANAMLPEIGARRVNLERAIVDVELSYSL